MTKKRKYNKFPLIIDPVRIPSLYQLNWHALQFALSVASRVDKNGRKGFIKKIKIVSYPACVACFQCQICGNLNHGESGQYTLSDSSFHEPLRSMLKSLGTIGKKNTNGTSKNLIGKCAEPCAVNAFLYDCSVCMTKPCQNILTGPDYQKQIIDNKLYLLSEAYRPRTLEHIDRCINCETLLGKNY